MIVLRMYLTWASKCLWMHHSHPDVGDIFM